MLLIDTNHKYMRIFLLILWVCALSFLQSCTQNKSSISRNYGGSLDENNIEAAYIYNHPENLYYYLFVNWDRCCNGVSSTYNIRIGRSTSPTGPFLDRLGRNLAEGGGSLFLDRYVQVLGNERFVGPGHAGIYKHTDNNYYFSHHFYDKENNGEPSLAIWKLSWENDWPKIDIDFKVKL